jgi:chorismate mutase/prephenate dehydratase
MGPISEKNIHHIFKEIISSCLALEEELSIAYLGPEGTHSDHSSSIRLRKKI